MANGTRALDQVLEAMVASGGAEAATVTAAALPDFCQYWPFIKKFLEWAKGQTNNWIVKLVIEGLIKLGDSKCG